MPRSLPIEPPPSIWEFHTTDLPDANGVVGMGADLDPSTLLAAYRHGIFPMPVQGPSKTEVLGWWSPHPRGILPMNGLRMSRSLRQSCRRFEVRVDTAFAEVIKSCGDPSRPGGWINPAIQEAYLELHHLGWAHSFETWDPNTNMMVGGLYGVSIGGLFAGESMFHLARDASKVALVELTSYMREASPRSLIDVQWVTPHLSSLGAIEIDRLEYLKLLARALDEPLPTAFS